MSQFKRDMQARFGSNWGFNLDGSFRAGDTVIYPQNDMFCKCQKCKDTYVVRRRYQNKKGKWKTDWLPCDCKSFVKTK